MNPLKIDIDKILDGAETARELLSNLNNNKKIFNFPLSPHNKNIKSINFSIINPLPVSKSKINSTDKAIFGNIKKLKKQKSANILNLSNQNPYIILKKKEIKNIELKEKDINNFKDLKKNNLLKDIILSNKENLKKIKKLLFQNNNNIKNHSNLLLKAKQNLLNNFENSNIKLISKREINKVDISSIMEIKNKPLIVKVGTKRSSTCLKGKKINEKKRKSNKNKKDIFSKFYYNEEDQRIKTPTHKIFIEMDRDRIKESLSEYINLNKNIVKLKRNSTNKYKYLKNEKIVPEENHFKAVLFSQEIKKLNKNLK